MDIKNDIFTQVNNCWSDSWYRNEYSGNMFGNGYSFLQEKCERVLKNPDEVFIHEINNGNKLYEAMEKSEKGSKWKPSVQRFCFNWMHNLRLLQHELRTPIFDKDSNVDLLYKTSEIRSFIQNERGKTRVISGNAIRDRVVRHSLNDNILNPILERYLIYENCASIAGKGISKQRKILDYHLRSYYDRHKTNEGYILIGDFSRFYDNIRHDIILNDIESKINDSYIMMLTRKIFKDFEVDVSYMTDEEYEKCMDEKFNSLEYAKLSKSLKIGEKIMRKSVNIGDQTSQIIGVYFPTRVDNYVKIVRGIKYYGRYMDDFYVISDSKEELLSILDGIKEISNQLGLFLNEKKTRIYKLQDGFTFLQTKYILQKNGYISKRINKDRLTAMRRKLKKLHKKYEVGERSFNDVYTTYYPWIMNFRKLMTPQQVKNMNNLFNRLFKNDKQGNNKSTT